MWQYHWLKRTTLMNQRYTDSREQHNPEVCLNIENSQNISFADFSDERVLVKYSQYKKMDLSSALFSPSKARQQQALAQDWIFVDSWLSKKYHPKPVPPFERNEDTLQALMTLVAFNERADEERVLVERVERMALRELEEEEKVC